MNGVRDVTGKVFWPLRVGAVRRSVVQDTSGEIRGEGRLSLQGRGIVV
jgi:hypothetical protein